MRGPSPARAGPTRKPSEAAARPRATRQRTAARFGRTPAVRTVPRCAKLLNTSGNGGEREHEAINGSAMR